MIKHLAGLHLYGKKNFITNTAWSVFSRIWTRKSLNTDAFHAVQYFNITTIFNNIFTTIVGFLFVNLICQLCFYNKLTKFQLWVDLLPKLTQTVDVILEAKLTCYVDLLLDQVGLPVQRYIQDPRKHLRWRALRVSCQRLRTQVKKSKNVLCAIV